MGGTHKSSDPAIPDKTKPAKKPVRPVEDDDYEDGDIATPKRDRDGNDDEPL